MLLKINKTEHRHWIDHKLVKKTKGAVVVAGLPKSGTTWLHSILADVFGCEMRHSKDVNMAKSKMIAIKEHGEFEKVKNIECLAALVYILRDPRDCICSFYNYCQTDYFRKNVDSQIPEFRSITDFYHNYFSNYYIKINWLHHPDQYFKHGVPIIRYEELYQHTKQQIQKLLDLWEIAPKHIDLGKLIETNSIKRNRENGLTIMGWRHIPKSFFSRGGGYEKYINELPEPLLKRINSDFIDYLTRWEYHLDYKK